jgi:hypothetical protein
MKKAFLLTAATCAALATAASAFFFLLFPAWCPQLCARYSPSADQVVRVYLARSRPEVEDGTAGVLARKRIVDDLRALAVPALTRALARQPGDAIEKYLAMCALSDIGAEAVGTVPLVITALKDPDIAMMADSIENSLCDRLVNLGPCPAWQAGLADPDSGIRSESRRVLMRSGKAEGFLMEWEALRQNAVTDREKVLADLDEFDFPGFISRRDRVAEVVAALTAVEKDGPSDMTEWARSIRELFEKH